MERKNKNRGYQQLRVWEDAVVMYVETCRRFRAMPFEMKRIAGQALASADSVHRNIAEGYCRRSVREYIHHLYIALGSLGESVSGYHAYLNAKQISEDDFEILDGQAFKLENGLLRLVESLERKRDSGYPEIAARHASAGFVVAETIVPVLTLARILEGYSARTIHFLKIDVEGAEAEVLQGISLKATRPWIILVKATEPNSPVIVRGDWEHLIASQGYSLAYFDGLNSFYVADEFSQLKERLAVPPNVFDDFVRFAEWSHRQKAATLQCEVASLKKDMRALEEAFQAEQMHNTSLYDALQAEQLQTAKLGNALQMEQMHTISVQQASINYLIGRTQELEANLVALSHYRGVLGGLRKIGDRLTGGGVRTLAKRVALLVAANRERFGQPQILIDVTVLAGHDVRTGIQRVTRGILMALLSDPPPGYRIEPIRADGDLYLYARRFTSGCLGLQEDVLTDDPVEAGHGDVFLALEWAAGLIPAMKPWFLKRRRSGMQIVFVVYDLLPLVRPEFFPPAMPPAALEWLTTVAEIADKVACDSRTVADELHAWLVSAKPHRLQPLLLGFFHLGADLKASLPSKGTPSDGQQILAKMRSRPSFLMVGTIEPRKGHRQALGAMERLWAHGVDANLVIVGQKGWMMDDFVERIKQHPQRESRLFWLQGVTDEMLEEIYCSSDALLAASEGEGFGLPLIEAAQHGLPIIARDIPVFREVASENAYYFRGETAKALADALRAWLSLGEAIPVSSGMPWLTWKQSSHQLLDVVLGRRWYRSWPDAEISPEPGSSDFDGVRRP